MLILSSYFLPDSENVRLAAVIAKLGGEFVPSPEDHAQRLPLLDRYIGEAEILLSGRLSEEHFKRAAKLKWIHIPWAGANSLLAVEAIRESTIPVTNSIGVMSDSVADQVMGYMIAVARSLPEQIRAQERREWGRYPTESPKRRALKSHTVGLIGYGEIGRAIAVRARAFGMRSIAVKRSAADRPPELDALYATSELPRLLAESNFVVVAVPLTPATEGMIGREQFRAMKSTATIINISRGSVIREAEMIEALNDGTIAGAALDVFEREPLPEDSPLWGMPNVIVTPHSAGGHVGFGAATVDLFIDNLRRFFAGEPLRNVVDKQEGY